MLRLIDVSAGYVPGHAVIRHITLEVAQGDFVCLIGPNMAGKTSVLRTISRVIPHSSGVILFQERNILSLPAHKIAHLGIAHVPEGRQLFPDLTVREHLLLAMRITGQRSEDREEYVLRLFPRLVERYNHRAGLLSGGEQQMLAIARALMTQPQLLMLDEPTLGLAPSVVDQLFTTLQDLHRDGLTILLAEQNAALALEVARHAYLIENGEIVLAGTADELRTDSRVQRAYLATP